MKNLNLLILTSEYPNPNSTYDTPVVHYYVKEWIKLGHQVRVIHFRSVFPKVFYLLANIFKGTLKRVFKTDFIPFHRLNSSIEFEMDGVTVISRPMFKIFPHLKFWQKTIKSHAEKIYHDNTEEGFRPDYIIGHFLNPQLPLINELKKYYPLVKTSLVLHENPAVIERIFGERAKYYLQNLDYIGFRFDQMKNIFIDIFGQRENVFICPSGIPDQYILSEIPQFKFKGTRIKLCFVGMLIPLKNVDVLLDAVYEAFPDKNFDLRILGDGLMRGQLEKKITELRLEECVSLEGKFTRDEVQNILATMDVFVMVSKPEAFGLVYLEAMGKGCLTIGTRGQGIDGVIEDRKNGFLCEPRSVEDLKKLLIEIGEMEYVHKNAIANRALETARKLTDRKVALSYLEKIDAF